MDEEEIIDITPEELKRYLSARDEGDYELIDVRQPEEYEKGHIPGAALMPLLEPDKMIADLKAIQKEIIFYCSIGSRSMIAGCFLAESGPAATGIYNLLGGIYAWNGILLPDFPRIQRFPARGNLTGLLETAMNMEKGAYRFYAFVAEKIQGNPVFEQAVQTLLSAEKKHARRFFQLLEKESTENRVFEQVFEELEGEILEGGESLSKLLEGIDFSAKNRKETILSTALTLEYAAYDLYRTMAAKTPESPAGDIFRAVAQSEKSHIRLIAETMGKLA